MQEFSVNYAAVLAAAIFRFALGWIWYSPAVFLRPWLSLTGQTVADMQKGPSMGIIVAVMLVANFVMAFVLAHAVHYAGAVNAKQGAAVGFFNWLGFIAVVMLESTLSEHRPFKLFTLNNGFQLLGLLIMGTTLAVWR